MTLSGKEVVMVSAKQRVTRESTVQTTQPPPHLKTETNKGMDGSRNPHPSKYRQ